MIIPKTRKGLPVIRKDKFRSIGKKYIGINATYKKGIITVYDRMVNKSDEEIKLILDHEYYHHIYSKLSKIIKIIWKLISNGRLRTTLNILMGNDYKKNIYQSGAAKSNPNEDFARTLAQGRIESKHFNYLDIKVFFAENILNYFSKK